jgi:hypothetical protein
MDAYDVYSIMRMEENHSTAKDKILETYQMVLARLFF